MSGQERSTLLAIVASLLVNGVVIYQLVQLFQGEALSGDDGPMLWARTVIWAVPAMIGLTIVMHVGARVFSRDRESISLVDERDRLFQLRGVAITTFVAGIGFVAAVAALAWGVRPVIAFTIIYSGMTFGDLAGNTLRFLSYRCGG